jgi:hypothetical protein
VGNHERRAKYQGGDDSTTRRFNIVVMVGGMGLSLVSENFSRGGGFGSFG